MIARSFRLSDDRVAPGRMGNIISFMGNAASYAGNLAFKAYSPYALKNSEYLIYVRTGDKRGAGTDSNVYLRLQDDAGKHSPDIILDVPFRCGREESHTYISRP